jgi:pilus assembly protein CpaB
MFLLKPKYVITLALVSGMVASYAVFYYLKQQESRMKTSEVVSRPVVVAAGNLTAGMILKLTDLQIRDWPENIIPDGSFSIAEVLEGRAVETDVTTGEPILTTKLAPEGSGGGVSSMIPPGMRAMTVAVNVVSGVGGFILPRTRVDILVTVASTDTKKEKTTKIILQNVEVLAVDQTYDKNDNDPITVKSVTLLVSPEDAEKLALAANEGKLQLTLRNSSDSLLSSTAGQHIGQLLSPAKPKAVPRKKTSRPRAKPKPKAKVSSSPKVVEVIRANVRSEVTFDEEESKTKESKSK